MGQVFLWISNLEAQTEGSLPLAQPAIYYHSQVVLDAQLLKELAFQQYFYP